MIIAYGSDIHLEFGTYGTTMPDADVLILAGDILIASHLDPESSKLSPFRLHLYKEWFLQISKQYEHILYVPGNHEHYNGDYHKTVNLLKDFVPSNVTILDNSFKIIDGLKFVGSTLWTDFNAGNLYARKLATECMPEFTSVKYKGEIFRTGDSMREFLISLDYLNSEIETNCVVITHHAPSIKSVNKKFDGNKLNPAFYSDLDYFIKGKEPKLWFHGHMHDNVKYSIGNTLVLCNPRGYIGHEPQAYDHKFEIVMI